MGEKERARGAEVGGKRDESEVGIVEKESKKAANRENPETESPPCAER